jgi:hypothetical protein
MSFVSSPVRILCAAAGFASVAAAHTVADAQSTGTARSHPAVCTAGVRVYTEKSQVPAPHDTVALPPGPPVRVTSPEEAEAAQLALRERAGKEGANGVLFVDETTDDGTGAVRMRRTVTAVFVPSDSAHAAAACKG